MRVSLVEQAKENKSYNIMCVGVQCLGETNANKFEKPGWGKVNPGQKLFGSTSWLSDESQLGRVDQGKRIL